MEIREEQGMEKNTEELRVRNYPYFLLFTIGYALFYSFCLYRNGSGITFPLFTAGTLAYFYLSFQKLGITWKKSNIWYAVAVELLGISTFLTGDGRIIRMNKWVIFFLLICLLLHTVYEDKKWDLTKYIGTIFTTLVMVFSCIGKPVSDGIAYRKLRKKGVDSDIGRQMKYVLIGLAICIPLALIIVLLLAGADAVFANFFIELFHITSLLRLIVNVMLVIFLTIVVFFVAYMMVTYVSRREIDERVGDKRWFEPTIAITIALVLALIYILFCGIQIRYLFMGGALGEGALPAGMIYSAYARRGFFQLMFVCVLNLLIVLAGMHWFKESKILRILLCVITGCTFIMIASSAFRLILYIQHQYLTFMRIFVLWSLFVIALLFVGVLLSICKKEISLFRYGMTVVTVCYLLLSFSRPDYWIAKVNTDNMTKETQYDFFKNTDPFDDWIYMTEELGTDAAPAILDKADFVAYESWDEDEYWEIQVEAEYGKVPDYEYDDIVYILRYEEWLAYMKENWKSVYLYNLKEETEGIRIRNFNVSRYLAGGK